MRCKWLVAFAILLILLIWAPVFAGPKGEYGYGDDDIPELMKPKSRVTAGKISDRLEVESLWNVILRMEQEEQPELSKEQDSKSVRRPATRQYPVRWR
jgi:hypothetical protein